MNLPVKYYEIAKGLFEYDQETGLFTKKKTGKQSGRDHEGYIRIRFNVKGKEVKLYAHRIAYYFIHGFLPNEVDHINQVKSDNRISNLRSVSRSDNVINTTLRISNKSGIKGVSWCRGRNKWIAQIQKDKKRHFLGYFNDINDAEASYIEAAKVLHG
jgi:hypothetical protein